MKDRVYRYERGGGQDRSQRNTVSQMSKPASLAVTGGEGEAFISNKLQDHTKHVLIQKSLSSLQVRP